MNDDKEWEREKNVKEEDVCPRCLMKITEFEGMEVVDEQVYYQFTCLKCGFQGKEWYELKFAGYTEDGAEITV